MAKPKSDRLFTWAGGKTKLLSHYKPHLPEDVFDKRLYEPFAGGAALFNFLANQRQMSAHLSDVNQEIIDLYRLVRDDPEFLIQEMNRYQEHWIPLDKPDRKSVYYELRKTYWEMEEGKQATALLYFLMKTGFNGIWQTCKASKGRYGTPVGLANQKDTVFEPDIIRAWTKKLANVEFSACSYKNVSVASKSFVFCDPPYRDSFTSYGTEFDDNEQIHLIEWCRSVHNNTGSVVWLSNRDAGDGFFEKHASDAKIHNFPVTYTAGRRKKTEDGFEAKAATEVLLIWA